MRKELIVSNKNDVLEIALLEDGRLMELRQAEQSHNISVGDFYLGKVKKLAMNLNAAFVDIGYERLAFLHYHDLGPQFQSLSKYVNLVRSGKFRTHDLKNYKRAADIDKDGIIDQVLKPDQNVLVQIAKEPISTKGPRVTSELSMAGRFVVLVPFADKVSVSQKIGNEQERKRLIGLVQGIKPEGFGVIIRTVAEGVTLEDLHADLKDLMGKWEQCFVGIKKKKLPLKVLSDADRASSILRDTFNEDFTRIICDDLSLASELKLYLNTIAPEKSKIIQSYKDEGLPIFEKFGIERQVKQSLGKAVNIPDSKGAYLVIEHTEALHVIDVNSGNIRKTQSSQEDSALEVNLKAASEIARQLRLRDMGGIIVVDFIDQRDKDHKKELFDHFRQEMAKDKAKHKILPPSKFGLVQITRQRVRPELKIQTTEPDPNENGQVEAPILLIEKIEGSLKDLVINKANNNISLHVHPFIAAYIKRGLPSIRLKWFLKYKKWVNIYERDSYKYLQYSFEEKKKK